MDSPYNDSGTCSDTYKRHKCIFKGSPREQSSTNHKQGDASQNKLVTNNNNNNDDDDDDNDDNDNNNDK
eukprot:4090295-Amphidinium_carterae.1